MLWPSCIAQAHADANRLLDDGGCPGCFEKLCDGKGGAQVSCENTTRQDLVAVHVCREYYTLDHWRALQEFQARHNFTIPPKAPLCNKEHGPGCKECTTCHFCRCRLHIRLLMAYMWPFQARCHTKSNRFFMLPRAL